MWTRYADAMPIVTKRIRVGGDAPNGDFNEIRNAYDDKSVRIPGGLTGLCTMVTADGAHITFKRQDYQSLWRHI